MTSKSIDDHNMRSISSLQTGVAGGMLQATDGKGRALKARPRRRSASGRRQVSNTAREPRFFSILTDDQIRIAEKVARGFHLRTAGLGMRTQSYCRLPPSTGNAEDWQVDLMRHFMLWAVAVQEEGLSLAAVLDVIVFGKSCRSVDRARKRRNGYAREQVLAALDLYRMI